ncbi:MAG TPA: DUF3379 family protein [Usitatibacter sp.]|nr:DUF3379 family protein [Usitatibacter sp.]
MNELEARRLLLSDPRHVPQELREAIAERPELAGLRDELLRLDERVRDELTRAPLPDALADRMVLGARYRSVPKVRLALAAAAAALAIALPMTFLPAYGDEVAMIDHVRESAWELRDNPGVPRNVVRASLAELGVGFTDSAIRVRHLGHCVVAGREGRHFTIDGREGVISFVVLPATDGILLADSVRKDGTVGVYERRGAVLVGAFASSTMEMAELREMLKSVLT